MNHQTGQQGQGQPAQQAQQTQQPTAGAQQQPQARPPPMYQPSQIRSLPTLSDDEKGKYEHGLAGLWNKLHSMPVNSPESLAARQKIIEFSRMLIGKIQQRRLQAQQQAHAQQQPGQQQTGQQQTGQQQPGQQPGQPLKIAQPRPQPAQQANPTQTTSQVPLQQQPVGGAAVAPGANGLAAAAADAPRPNPQAANLQRPKIPDHILNHVNKITFRMPAQLAEKSGAEPSKWVEEIKERYAKALMTMENGKLKVTQIEKVISDRAASGNPFSDEELRQLQVRKELQLKHHSDAHKWVDSVRKQQGNLQGTGQGSQNGAFVAPQAGPVSGQGVVQGTSIPQAAVAAAPAQVQNNAQNPNMNNNNNNNNNQNAVAPVNAAVEAVQKQQQHMAGDGRASPVANGTPPVTQPQVRPTPSVQQPAQQQPLVQHQQIKQEPTHQAPLNAAIASANSMTQAGTPTQVAARVQTPQAATPVTAAGPTRALSHSAAMTLANQRATNTPGGAPVQGQPVGAGTPASAGGAVNQGVMGSGMHPQQQQQQGHPHAHPTQTQTTIQSKMPIPKQLPEKSTSVPQGVSVGGGINNGRPTMSQGSGTLGGVMNQPPINRIPAYNHEAEGDHVLSKKKLDELVRQVCGGSTEGQDGNLLTPEVEENVLSMADSFVDSVLHAACRNSKERGSKVLEIRDIQLVLERTYNIRVPGYSSDELRTVRKILPSAGWIAKMSAVQAAKVMPGKGE
ncbi:hypothetical protein G7046_g6437 [Stylonectria norvegica]|nr:hypothetical protein G7046_g6437 [Stylonectria norvegica]